jgi:hypothetical protein
MSNEITLQKIETELHSLSIEELISLNRTVIERIKYLQKARSLGAMTKFKIGETVCFYSHDGNLISGKIIKFNIKTITIITDENQQWNVSPQFLMRKI